MDSSHQYFILSEFSTDPLEKEFSKLRQGSEGTYFITVQQVIEKLNISRAKLLISLDNLAVDFSVDTAHCCLNCGFLMDESSAEIFDKLLDLESFISPDTSMALIYISGYTTRNIMSYQKMSFWKRPLFTTKNMDNTDLIDRGGLNIFSDNTCQWVIHSFLIFNTIKGLVCRTSLSNILIMVSEFYNFEMQRHHRNILSNIFLNNLCQLQTPRSNKKPAQKILKLS